MGGLGATLNVEDARLRWRWLRTVWVVLLFEEWEDLMRDLPHAQEDRIAARRRVSLGRGCVRCVCEAEHVGSPTI